MDQSDAPPTAAQRLPTVNETVELQCLISSPHLNGRRGDISTYVADPDIHRYRVALSLDDGARQVIAVNSRNISVLNNNQDDRPPRCEEWDLVHVLVQCHVDSERRCAQFRECAHSLSMQTGRCRIFVGISGPPQFRQKAIVAMRMAAVSSDGWRHQWFMLEGTEANVGESQSLKSLLSASMLVCPSAWLTFLDCGGLCHPLRVRFLQDNVRKMRESSGGRRVFSVRGKILVKDKKFGNDSALSIESFINGDNDLMGITEMTNDTTEHSDFCIRSDFFREVLDELSSRPPTNLEFLDALVEAFLPHNPPSFIHSDQRWLCVRYSEGGCNRNGHS